MSKNPHLYWTKSIIRCKMKKHKMNYNTIEEINYKTTQTGHSICIASYQSSDVNTRNKKGMCSSIPLRISLISTGRNTRYRRNPISGRQ